MIEKQQNVIKVDKMMEKLQKIFVTTLSWAALEKLVQVEQIKGKLKQASLKKVIDGDGWMFGLRNLKGD